MLDVVNKSDHVLTIKVVDLDMIDESGNVISDPKAEAGPGSKNVIRLKARVVKVHLTNSSKVPTFINIPIYTGSRYSLGQARIDNRGIPYPEIAVLKGKLFRPAYVGTFKYPIYELDTIMALFKLKMGNNITKVST